MNNTICAISTPAGTGGIAVIRVSGKDALPIVDKVFRGRKPLAEAKGYSVHFGEVTPLPAPSPQRVEGSDAKLATSVQKGDSEAIDQVLCTVFRAPHSFTGEDTVEIACHGSIYIQQEILRVLTDAGCRPAGPGEFTQRAFVNGKIDLTQAEAVADLIAAESEAEKNLALSHLKGGISSEIQNLRDQLLHFTSLIELELDFADHEDLEFVERSELHSLAEKIEAKITELLSSFRLGNAIKHGIPVAIIGPTNAGKSTLLNALLGEDKAIVSDIHGTTRDLIEDTLHIHGVQFRFTDTAGLRSTQDTIEGIGIQRSISAARKADLVLFLQELPLDGRFKPDELIEQLGLEDLKHKVLRVYNKADLVPEGEPLPDDGICISAREGNLDALKEAIFKAAGVDQTRQNGAIISSARHYDALSRAHDAIRRVQQALTDNVSGEFLSMDLQDCLEALGEITGQISSQEVLNNIFSKFCIGK